MIGRSASAVGINNCFRSIVAAITAIFSSSALHALGPGILFSILAGINVLNAIPLILCMRYGQYWRTMQGEKPSCSIEQDKEAELARTGSRHSTI